MSTQYDAWALVCHFFLINSYRMRSKLSRGELAALPALGNAIKPTATDLQFVECPYCGIEGEVFGDDRGGFVCHCLTLGCGVVKLGEDDTTALMLDQDWFRRGLRLALGINSRDAVDLLSDDGVWLLGRARRSPVVLARDLYYLWREPALLERVQILGKTTLVITPKSRQPRGAPFGAGVQWLPLEERFTLYGGGINFIAPPDHPAPTIAAVDPTAPVCGPFSADFRWVTLAQWHHGPIRCTEGQAAVFKSLWSFKGEPVKAEQIMQRAGLGSGKPIDLFKVKTRDKGKPEAEGPLFAYRLLMVTHKRYGRYAMPCAGS